jgi:hypothetical protein
MSKVIEQDVAVLSSSKHGLVYLTANDWALLADKATRAHFKKGDVLVQRGKKADGVYLLLKGIARVQIVTRPPGPGIGPGEICGEMSFLEDAAASASVIAEGDVEAYHLDRPTLQGLPVSRYQSVPAAQGVYWAKFSPTDQCQDHREERSVLRGRFLRTADAIQPKNRAQN